MISIWLVLFFHLVSAIQPYQTTKYYGLISQDTPWQCGSAVAATLLTLAGEDINPRLQLNDDIHGTSLASLTHYLEERGWEVTGFRLTWKQILYFFQHFPNRPLLAHRNLEKGHYVILLGLVRDFLVVADPASGVRAVPPPEFLRDFSGYTLYFPQLPSLSTVEKILFSAERRLRLLTQAVAEF